MTSARLNSKIGPTRMIYRRSWRSISQHTSHGQTCTEQFSTTTTASARLSSGQTIESRRQEHPTCIRAITTTWKSILLNDRQPQRHFYQQQPQLHLQAQRQRQQERTIFSFLGLSAEKDDDVHKSAKSLSDNNDVVPMMPPRQGQVNVPRTANHSHGESYYHQQHAPLTNDTTIKFGSSLSPAAATAAATTTDQDQDHLIASRIRRLDFQELLNAPVGSLTPSSSWTKAEKVVEQLGGVDGDDYRALLLLERLGREPDSNIRLTNETVHTVVSNWQGNLLNRSRDKASRGPVDFVRPSNVWKTVLDLDRRAVQMESNVFKRIIEGTCCMSGESFSAKDGPYLAEEILSWMMDDRRIKDNPLIRPDAYTFAAVMTSWLNGASHSYAIAREAPEKSFALLNKLKTLYASGWGRDFMPTKEVYKKVMMMYAHQGDGDMVESLLEDLYTFYLDQIEQHPHLRRDMEIDLSPSTPFFSLVLYAWSKSNDPIAAERAEMILDRMLELESGGELQSLFVPANCFNIVMVAWSRKRAPESPFKIQALFDRMVQLSKDENRLSKSRWRSAVLPAISNRSKAPTGGSYVALITTFARNGSKKAEEVYRKWKEEHALGNVDMRIDSNFFENIVKAIHASNVPERAEYCDRWIQIALENNDDPSPLKLDSVIFATTINAWCHTKTSEGVKRAEELLGLLRDRHESFFPSDYDTAPTVHCYLPIVQAHAERLGNVEKAEELVLEWMSLDPSRKQHQKISHGRRSISTDGNQAVHFRNHRNLDTRLFNICLKGWLSVAPTSTSAVSRAERLLLSMDKYGVRPNAASFKYVLSAWRDRNKRQVRGWTMGSIGHDSPKAREVVALLDKSYKLGTLGVPNDVYLALRQDWQLLAVE